MALMRSTTLRGFSEIVTELGGDPAELLRQAGLPVRALTGSWRYVQDWRVAQALELAARRLQSPAFGLLLSARQPLGGLEHVAAAIRHAPTLADALVNAQRYLSVHHWGSTVQVVEDPLGDEHVAGLTYSPALDADLYPQAGDNLVANMHRFMQAVAGPRYLLRSVELAHRAPADARSYERTFGGVEIHEGRPISMLRIQQIAIELPTLGARTPSLRAATAVLRPWTSQTQQSAVHRTRAAVQDLLGSGGTSIASVAHRVGLSVRTLQRELESEGTSFRPILDEVRRDLAEQLLADMDRSLSEVASHLEFDDRSSFNRAALRWWGQSPSQMRGRRVAARDSEGESDRLRRSRLQG